MNKKVIILSHIITTVPAYDLKEYFLNQKNELLFIGHPLFYKEDRPGSFFEFYKNGSLTKKIKHKNRKIPPILSYIKDFFLSVYWILKTGKKYDLIICLDNLNALTGLFLKNIGIVKKVIYYTIDFTPERFDLKILNAFYHYIDKLCVKYCDSIWNVSPRIAEGREKIRGLKKEIFNKQIVVPIGIWFDRLKRKSFEDIEKNTIIYAGGLDKHQGVQIMLEAIPKIIKKIPDFKFKIIGLGDYEKNLKNKIKELTIEKYVDFIGYLEKHADVENELAKCSLAVAMYDKEITKWSYYADPSKIKSYLSAGLPVITTGVTYIGKDLEKNRCGFVIEYDSKILAEKVVELLQNRDLLKEFRENAINFSKDLDWNNILNKALNK